MNENLQNKDASSQYLLFYIGEDLYAIEASYVSEIVEYSQITKVPNMAPYIKGVTNIRGNIVSVVDLSQRLGFSSLEEANKTSIVVVNYKGERSVLQIGIMVDEVYAVDNIEIANIHKVPEFGAKIDKNFLVNMSYYQENYIAVLDIQTLLNIDDLAKLVM